MKKFIVTGINKEYLSTQEIEAKDLDEAKEKYTKLFDEGMITVGNNEIIITNIKETD